MLTRINASNEISILPTGLGNHYTSNNRLVPPGGGGGGHGSGAGGAGANFKYPQRPSIFSKSSVDNNDDDPEAPEANMSFRAQSDYFGPDVLVILGVVLASGGAILTLVSLYCRFRQPAIQATIAGIGPSLIGIGMLFCVLRLFFCSFFTTRTCCECFGDGIRYLGDQFPCFRKFQKRLPNKKRVQPAQVKINAAVSRAAKVAVNGQSVAELGRNRSAKTLRLGSQVKFHRRGSATSQQLEMVPVSVSSNPNTTTNNSNSSNKIRQEDIVGNPRRDCSQTPNDDSNLSIGRGRELSENLIPDHDDFDDNIEDFHPRQDVDDILKDEIAILDQRLDSANSNKVQNNSINELVLKHSKT